MMTTHIIEVLLSGSVDLEIELEIASRFPIKLVPVARSDALARDYRLEADGQSDLGSAWTRLGPSAGIPYLALVVPHPTGLRIYGIAWQSPEYEGRWFIQLQSVSDARLHS